MAFDLIRSGRTGRPAVALLIGAAALASCAPRSAPRPVEAEQPRAQQAPLRPEAAPAPPAASPGWEEAPLTPGDWSYGGEGSGSFASYGEPGRPVFTLRCEPNRQVLLARIGASGGATLVIRTTAAARTFPAAPQPGGVTARLAAEDAFLDEIAFSRGRFTVEASGAPMLVVPSWPEFARVVEDCRG
jgi:hypothetical protein